jgi:hypothetical protein
MKTMRINRFTVWLAAAFMVVAAAGCADFEELSKNPNAASSSQPVPPSRFLNRVLFEIYTGGGVTGSEPGNISETPYNTIGRWSQYIVSNDVYYGGNNFYNWSESATMYSVVRNVVEMEKWSNPNNSEELAVNPYTAMGKFLRAYAHVWYAQRVGDIPMSEAGQGLANLTPKYDTQKDVYIQSLDLLDEANSYFAQLRAKSPAPIMDGDIYLNNSLERWQKAVNSYTLRVLISLSKRADDTPELKVKERFAAIVSDPAKYPVMSATSDNVQFKFNSGVNRHPKFGLSGNYNSRHNVGNTYLDLAAAKYNDPRTFVIACPAPAKIKDGLAADDFAAYIGADISVPLPDISKASSDGAYSHSNFDRYYRQSNLSSNAEPYIIFGYAETCLNIAEGINRGWATGSAQEWYEKGIKASFDFYGIKDGGSLNIFDRDGAALGKHAVNFAAYFSNPEVTYKGDNADGLRQILEQKYINFFQNSGWEAFFQWRRTGIPELKQGTVAINPTTKIPRRFQYPVAEANENSANLNEALTRQYGGNDDIYADVWSVK